MDFLHVSFIPRFIKWLRGDDKPEDFLLLSHVIDPAVYESDVRQFRCLGHVKISNRDERARYLKRVEGFVPVLRNRGRTVDCVAGFPPTPSDGGLENLLGRPSCNARANANI